MQINKTDRCLHIVSFNTKEHIANGYVFICTSEDDDDYRSVNKALLNNSFIHSEFQEEFNKLNATKANIEELVSHQFITSNNMIGFELGHQYINNCITSGKGLLHIVNVGDWLSTPGVVSIAGVDTVVSDIGKWYGTLNAYDTGEFVNYNFVVAHASSLPLLETHELIRPLNVIYSDSIMIKDGQVFRLAYDHNESLKVNKSIGSRKVHYNGNRYSNLNSMCCANNIPIWYGYGIITYSYMDSDSIDCRFVD